MDKTPAKTGCGQEVGYFMGYLESIRASCWCELLGLLPGARGGTGPQETSASTVVEFPPGTKKLGKIQVWKNLGARGKGSLLGLAFASSVQELPRPVCSHGHLGELPPEQSHQAHVHEAAAGGEGPGHVHLDRRHRRAPPLQNPHAGPRAQEP